MPIVVTGVHAAIKSLRQKAIRDGIAIADGLETAAEVLLNKSQELVPVETGDLKTSGRIETNGKVGFAAEFTVVYGGTPEVDYAWVVHERTDAFHEPPTQAKYVTAAIPLVRGVMTNAVRRKLSVEVAGITE